MNTVLLIDDDCELIQQIKESLRNKYEVKCFEEPKEAFTYLRKFPVSAVILDYHLKNSNGLLVVWDLVEKYPLMPVLFISSDSKVEHLIGELEFPHVDFLVKPFKSQDLYSSLEKLEL